MHRDLSGAAALIIASYVLHSVIDNYNAMGEKVLLLRSMYTCIHVYSVDINVYLLRSYLVVQGTDHMLAHFVATEELLRLVK